MTKRTREEGRGRERRWTREEGREREQQKRNVLCESLVYFFFSLVGIFLSWKSKLFLEIHKISKKLGITYTNTKTPVHVTYGNNSSNGGSGVDELSESHHNPLLADEQVRREIV